MIWIAARVGGLGKRMLVEASEEKDGHINREE